MAGSHLRATTWEVDHLPTNRLRPERVDVVPTNSGFSSSEDGRCPDRDHEGHDPGNSVVPSSTPGPQADRGSTAGRSQGHRDPLAVPSLWVHPKIGIHLVFTASPYFQAPRTSSDSPGFKPHDPIDLRATHGPIPVDLRVTTRVTGHTQPDTRGPPRNDECFPRLRRDHLLQKYRGAGRRILPPRLIRLEQLNTTVSSWSNTALDHYFSTKSSAHQGIVSSGCLAGT